MIINKVGSSLRTIIDREIYLAHPLMFYLLNIRDNESRTAYNSRRTNIMIMRGAKVSSNLNKVIGTSLNE